MNKFSKKDLIFGIGKNGFTPIKGTKESRGYDLFSSEEIKLTPFKVNFAKTDIKVKFPEHYSGFIAIRSSLAACGVILPTSLSVIDYDYQGFIKIPLIYLTHKSTMTTPKGVRFAQLILIRQESSIISTFKVSAVKFDKIMESSTRKDGGFGSTGKY